MTAPTWSTGGGGAVPSKGAPGFDPRIVVGVVVMLVIAVFLFLATRSGGGEPTPTTTTPDTLADGLVTTTGEGGETTPPTVAPTTSPLPEPYGKLGIKPVTGCDGGYGCIDSASFSVATTEGLREVTRDANADLRVRVTITNPTPFEAAITEVTHGDKAAFPRQNTTPEGTIPLCPDLGDPPIKLSAKSATTCDMAFKFADDVTSYLTMGIEYAYLFETDDGSYDEQTGTLTSSDLATLTVRPVGD